jgi:hypothetical protein
MQGSNLRLLACESSSTVSRLCAEMRYLLGFIRIATIAIFLSRTVTHINEKFLSRIVDNRTSCLGCKTSAFSTPAAQDCARIVFDCRMANDLATINRESTNENNTDVDRWADARRLRINGKPCS